MQHGIQGYIFTEMPVRHSAEGGILAEFYLQRIKRKAQTPESTTGRKHK